MLRRLVLFILPAIGAMTLAQTVWAYSDVSTHPGLTQEIATYYNFLHPEDPITEEQKAWMMEGSKEEDTPPRWINHFCDPIHNSAWSGYKEGSLAQELTRALGSLVLSTNYKPVTSVEWVTNPAAQMANHDYGGEWTWEKAMDYMGHGDKKNGFIALGHILHLLEDMTVPEHVRDDSHGPDDPSPYEGYTSAWGPANIEKDWHFVEQLSGSNQKPPADSSIEEYLKETAEYTNKNFFSKDTINDSRFNEPKIDENNCDEKFCYSTDSSNSVILAKIKFIKKDSLDTSRIYIIEPTDEKILQSYFSYLGKKAILEGAGVAELFMEKSKDAQVAAEFPQHLVGLDSSRAYWFVPQNFSLVGLISRIWRAAYGTTASIFQAMAQLFDTNNSNQVIVSSSDGSYANPNTGSGNSIETRSEIDGENFMYASDSESGTQQNGAVPESVLTNAIQEIESKLSTNSDVASQNQNPHLPPILKQAFLSFGGGGSGSSIVPYVPVVSGDQNNQNNTNPSSGVGDNPDKTDSGLSFGGDDTSGATSTNTASSGILVPEMKINFFNSSYNPDNLKISLNWQATSSSATDTIEYGLEDVSAENETHAIVSATTTDTYETNVSEVGRDYIFKLTARSQKQNISVSTTTKLVVQPILKNVYLYSDSRPDQTGKYAMDWYWDKFPFLPPLHDEARGGHGAWQAVVAYLNRDPNPDNLELTTSGAHQPQDLSGILKMRPDGSEGVDSGSYIFALSDEWHGPGGGLHTFSNPPPKEDNHWILQLGQKMTELKLSPSDYVTFAFYDFYRSGGGTQDLKLLAMDKTRYFFQESLPDHLAPTQPAKMDLIFDPLHSAIDLKSGTSTDADTLDYLLKYQGAISLKGEAPTTWQDLSGLSASLAVVFGKEYQVFVRALDDFGKYSAELIQDWKFPSDYVPVPSQASHDQIISTTGKWLSGQRINLLATTTIQNVAMWLGQGGPGWYCCSESYLELRSDENFQIGPVIEASSPVRFERGEDQGERTYRFSEPQILQPGYYWLVPRKGPDDVSNNTIVFGVVGGSEYENGYWGEGRDDGIGQDDSGKDAYFLVR